MRRGLTRLEAALAIALIAGLIALALSRLEAARVAARQVRLNMLLTTAQTSATLFYARCAARASCERVEFEGVPVAGVHGWPAASLEGVAAALKAWGETTDIDWQSERIDGVPALRARLKPVIAAGACEFTYAQAATPGAVPRIVLVGNSCP